MGEARSMVEGFYEAFNRNDLDAARQYFADDIETVDPTGTIHGWDELRAFIEGFKVASPDARLVARNWLEDGKFVAVEGTFAGTFTGPFRTRQGEMPPTGASFELPFVEVNEIDNDGKIASHRTYYDQMNLMSAMGMTPPGGG